MSDWWNVLSSTRWLPTTADDADITDLVGRLKARPLLRIRYGCQTHGVSQKPLQFLRTRDKMSVFRRLVTRQAARRCEGDCSKLGALIVRCGICDETRLR